MRTSRVITPALASWERCQLHEAGTLARVAVLAPRQHRQQLGRVNVSGQHATPPRGSAGPTTSVLLDGVPVTVQPPTVGTSPTLVWPRPAGHRWQPTRVRSKPSRSTPMDASWPPAAGHQHVDHVPSAAQHAGPAIFKKLPRSTIRIGVAASDDPGAEQVRLRDNPAVYCYLQTARLVRAACAGAGIFGGHFAAWEQPEAVLGRGPRGVSVASLMAMRERRARARRSRPCRRATRADPRPRRRDVWDALVSAYETQDEVRLIAQSASVVWPRR